MGGHIFKGVYQVEVSKNRIVLPKPFYRTIIPEKKVVLTVMRNRLFEKNFLIGYKTEIWRFLKNHLTVLCDAPRVRPLHAGHHAISPALANFLKDAVECEILAPQPLEEDRQKKPRETTAGGDYTLRVPPGLPCKIGLEDRAILVGHGYHFEVWTPKDWQDFKKEIQHGRRSSSHPDIVA